MNNEEGKRNKPIVAKTNFVIAHKGLVKGVSTINDPSLAKFEDNQEVDEWLMGSGNSDHLTAGSKSSHNNL